jgi:hypothetical protein
MKRYMALSLLLLLPRLSQPADETHLKPTAATEPASAEHSYVPENGFVPDERTAIRIAEAVLIPIYGGRTVRRERPFHASLHDGVWSVEGTLPRFLGIFSVKGGVAIIEIAKSDGRVLRVSHGK